MKKTVHLSTIIFAFLLFFCLPICSTAADIDRNRDRVKEEIWELEEAYFTNLYKADYEAVLAIVHR